MLDWAQPPYSSLCLLRSASGLGIGWLTGPDRNRIVTAGHVLADSDLPSLRIFSAFAGAAPDIAVQSVHFADYSAQRGAGGPADYGSIVVSGVPAGCTALKMVVPPPGYTAPANLLAYNFAANSIVWNAGAIASQGRFRFLDTMDASPGFSGGPIVIAAQMVGWSAIGIHTDAGYWGNALAGEGGAAPPGHDQYQMATGLTLDLQSKILGAST